MTGIGKLSATRVKKISMPGRYGDGNGLYLQVTSHGKSWLFRYKYHKREHFMGLGSVRRVSLAHAREMARQAQRCLIDGIDPLQARKASLGMDIARKSRKMTFAQCATEYIRGHRYEWRNEKHGGFNLEAQHVDAE